MRLDTRGRTILLSALAIGVVAYTCWRRTRKAAFEGCKEVKRDSTVNNDEETRTPTARSSLPKQVEGIQIVFASTERSVVTLCEALHDHLGLTEGSPVDLDRVSNLDGFLRSMDNWLVIFVISTTTGGTALPSGEALLHFLQSNKDLLDLDFDFLVLGLGDSARDAESLGKSPKEIDSLLAEAGATRALPICYIDAAYHPQISTAAWCDCLTTFLSRSPRYPVLVEDTHALDGQHDQPVVAYGTWAGTSRLMAEETAKLMSSETGCAWRARTMKGMTAEWLSKRRAPVVFVICSHTYGDPPPDCDELKQSLCGGDKRAPLPDLSNLKFSILGTGDTFYFRDLYCKAAYDLRQWLSACQAIELMPVGTADLNRNQFLEFRQWLNQLVQSLVRGASDVRIFSREQLDDKSSPSPTSQLFVSRRSSQSNNMNTVGDAPRVDSIKVFYATQSGTAERFAMRIASTLSPTTLIDVEDFRSHFPPAVNTLHLFVVSTYGDGEPPETAARFWSHLKREPVEQPENKWVDVPIILVGCGNSGYPHYNRFVLRLSRKLKTLGAKRLLPVLRLDELDSRVESVFSTWLTTKLKPLVQKLQGAEDEMTEGTKFSSCLMSSEAPYRLHTGPGNLGPTTVSATSKGERLFKAAEAVVTKVDLIGEDWSVERPSYQVYISSKIGNHGGGNCGIYPPLSEGDVDEILSIFSYEGVPAVDFKNQRFHFSTEESAVPQGTTLRNTVRCMTDFSFTPTQRWMEQFLRPVLPVDHPLLTLMRDSEWHRVNVELPMLTLQEVLFAAHRDMPLSLPLDFLLALPRLIVRQYTIASAVSRPKDGPPMFSLVVTESTVDREHVSPWASGVVKSQSLIGRASSFFRNVALGGVGSQSEPFPALPTPTHFQSTIYEKPGVWVATGAGIAPFLAFIDERRRQSSRESWPPTALFYGTRTSAPSDFLGGEIICNAVKDGLLSFAFFAFSRNEESEKYGTVDKETAELILRKPASAGTFHVPHALDEEAETVQSVMQANDAAINICGSTRMAAPVLLSIGAHLGEAGDMDQMKREGRVHLEIW